MNNNEQSKTGTIYVIEIEEQLDESWAELFGNFEITYKTDNRGKHFTLLKGMVIDQAALNGILNQIWNLNITVVSVSKVK